MVEARTFVLKNLGVGTPPKEKAFRASTAPVEKACVSQKTSMLLTGDPSSVPLGPPCSPSRSRLTANPSRCPTRPPAGYADREETRHAPSGGASQAALVRLSGADAEVYESERGRSDEVASALSGTSRIVHLAGRSQVDYVNVTRVTSVEAGCALLRSLHATFSPSDPTRRHSQTSRR